MGLLSNQSCLQATNCTSVIFRHLSNCTLTLGLHFKEFKCTFGLRVPKKILRHIQVQLHLRDCLSMLYREPLGSRLHLDGCFARIPLQLRVSRSRLRD